MTLGRPENGMVAGNTAAGIPSRVADNREGRRRAPRSSNAAFAGRTAPSAGVLELNRPSSGRTSHAFARAGQAAARAAAMSTK
jgi:hypothetical protein